ncbi:MAG TPA: DUF354 domain-containing protein [Bacteroidales bacterium]|nr:hypothetical protein [Bacteroidales bacterium]HRC88530.1 DUF354 domain-containing protein [Bacteroidales bacterium]
MNILIDIGHPAHVHYYRNLAKELEKKNHKVYWTVKDIPVAKKLLEYYGFTYYVLPKKSDTLLGKIFKQVLYDTIILFICISKRINLAIGTSVSVVNISRITKIKSIVFDDDDDDVQPIITKYVNPYADTLLSPEALKGKRARRDTIFYPGYHELAYLHPARFTPDPGVLEGMGIKKDEPFFIMRFNSFKAHHDIGVQGLSLSQKKILINLLSQYGKIFITTEREIEKELQPYQLQISPEKIHSLMAYSTMFLSDSQTMTSEAAMLGVPALRCNSFAGRISCLQEQEEKYGLTFAFQTEEFNKMIKKIMELLNMPDLKQEWHKRRDIMLQEKIDVTAFWLWFIENYPSSVEIMNNNNDYPLRFRF